MSDAFALELLACPRCRGALAADRASLGCDGCGAAYDVVDGVPVLVADGDEHKRRQAQHFDEAVDEEWEIARPFDARAFHRYLIEDKFRRSVSALRPLLDGGTVLVACGGSGMDAHLLARAGARVVTSDLSLGAARRARKRALRFDLPITSIVADVERLPFRDRSVDVVYVHDGLHHLERPAAGLAEMARVARVAVCVSEPARAAVTGLAVRLGLALEQEDAGNAVARLLPEDFRDELAARGFGRTRAERYAMYYRHEPGRAVRALSHPALLPLAKGGFRLANLALGRAGNKLALQAVRDAEAVAR